VVQEALAGLPGVESVDADLKNDQLRVRYDPERVTTEQLLKKIDNEGFESKVISVGSP
jgi:copper chaperone CopZ